MKIETELLMSITRTITSKYGEDVAQEVVVALLRRRNPLRHVEKWATSYARGLVRRESSNFRQPNLVPISDSIEGFIW